MKDTPFITLLVTFKEGLQRMMKVKGSYHVPGYAYASIGGFI